MNIVNNIKRIFSYSIGSIALFSILAALFSLITKMDFRKSIFNFNYILGSIIIANGILGFYTPVSIKKIKGMVDYSNIIDIVREKKDDKIEDALINIFWGITNILLVGVIEIII